VTFITLRELLQGGKTPEDLRAVQDYVEDEHPADLAEVLEDLTAQEAWTVLKVLPPEVQAEVFGHLDATFQVEIAHTLRRRDLAGVVSNMSADERADLFNNLSSEQQEALLPALAQAEREDIRRLSSYEEGTAGSIMTSDYATLTPDLTASAAIEKLRREAPDKETIYQAYVLDGDRRLVGAVSLQDLILSRANARIADIMEDEPVHATVDDAQEDVARLVSRYDLIALPVLDTDGRLVGIVTHDDAMDVAEQEMTEDFQKFGTVGKITESLRDASVGLLYRKRVFWLVLLVFGNLLSGAGIAYFEETIATYIALVFFLPLLIASAGNAGSQSSTLMVRAMATGDVEAGDWARVLGRELLVAIALGATMAVAIAGIGVFRGGPEIALVVSSTMILVVILGSLIGISLPFILSKLNLDPATASGPLVTSMADACGVVVYFSIATLVLPLPPPGAA